MHPFRITLSLSLLCVIGLTACGAETPPPAAPTATSVSFLTDPGQATSEALSIAAAPTFTPSPVPVPTDTPLPTPIAAVSLTPEATATAITPPSPTPEPKPLVKVDETLSTPINVRAGPGTDYPVIGQFQPGQEATVTGRNEDSSWWQVSLAEAGTSESLGWVAGQLVVAANVENTPLVEAPPPPPPPTPDPNAVAQAEAEANDDDDDDDDDDEPQTPEEQANDLRCGQDFCVTYQAMVPIWENGGCIGNHSIFVTVLQGPPPGVPMDGVVIGDTFNNIEVASGDKGPGAAEVTLWMNSMSLKVKRHIDGTPYTSEESYSFTSHDELIPAEVLAANGYCDGSVEKCRQAQQTNQVCRGHYSWRVTFHKFD